MKAAATKPKQNTMQLIITVRNTNGSMDMQRTKAKIAIGGNYIFKIEGDLKNIPAVFDEYLTWIKENRTEENKNKLEILTELLVEEKTLLGDQVQQVLKCA